MAGIFASCPILSLISWQGRGGGGGIDLVVVVPLPPQQIKTTEFQFSQGAHFQEDLKVIEIWSLARMPNIDITEIQDLVWWKWTEKNYTPYDELKP